VAARIWRVFGKPEPADAVLQYVETQQEHHRTRTFQEEFRDLLRRYGVNFDEPFWTETNRATESRFQRLFIAIEFLGRCARLK